MFQTRCLPLDGASVSEAVALLRAGEVVAFPTETVYGLGADASNPAALAKIFAAKGRPSDHPLIVHLAQGADTSAWVREWPAMAEELTAVFWPGPLTLILKKNLALDPLLTGGQDSVGLRCPSHPGAQALLEAFGGGLAAPSANRFGRISPTTAAHVMDELQGRIPLVLDGGDSEVGIESTILDLSRGFPVLLRPGDLNIEDIEAVLGQRVARPDSQAPRVSGSLAQHYAPEKPLELVPAQALADSIAVLSASGRVPCAAIGWTSAFCAVARKLGFARVSMESLTQTATDIPTDAGKSVLMGLPDSPHAVAHHLYAALRWADHQPVRLIVIEQPSQTVIWEGVADRLRRASARV
jgi:L-threonylcarbamoyladenylate synthase